MNGANVAYYGQRLLVQKTPYKPREVEGKLRWTSGTCSDVLNAADVIHKIIRCTPDAMGSWDRKRLRCVLNGKLPDFAQHPNKTHVLDCLMKTMPLHFFETDEIPATWATEEKARLIKRWRGVVHGICDTLQTKHVTDAPYWPHIIQEMNLPGPAARAPQHIVVVTPQKPPVAPSISVASVSSRAEEKLVKVGEVRKVATLKRKELGEKKKELKQLRKKERIAREEREEKEREVGVARQEYDDAMDGLYNVTKEEDEEEA